MHLALQTGAVVKDHATVIGAMAPTTTIVVSQFIRQSIHILAMTSSVIMSVQSRAIVKCQFTP